jgi:hypothetical protein
MQLYLSYGEIPDLVLDGDFDFESALEYIEMLEENESSELEGADVILTDGENEWFLDSDENTLFWSKFN